MAGGIDQPVMAVRVVDSTGTIIESFGTLVGGTVTSGTDTRVFFQDGTAVGQSAGLTFAKGNGSTTGLLTVGGSLTTTGNIILDGATANYQVINNGSAGLALYAAGYRAYFGNTATAGANIASGAPFSWSSSSTDARTAYDTSISRSSAGVVQVGTTAVNALGSLNAATLATVGVNGQSCAIQSLTELTTIAAAATTDTAIQIPANAIVLGVSVRVTTVIPTAATFTVIGTTSSTAFQTGATVSTAATTTDAGTKSCPYLNATAQTIRITPNAQPADNTGRVRVTIHYISVTPPTS